MDMTISARILIQIILMIVLCQIELIQGQDFCDDRILIVLLLAGSKLLPDGAQFLE